MMNIVERDILKLLSHSGAYIEQDSGIFNPTMFDDERFRVWATGSPSIEWGYYKRENLIGLWTAGYIEYTGLDYPHAILKISPKGKTALKETSGE